MDLTTLILVSPSILQRVLNNRISCFMLRRDTQRQAGTEKYITIVMATSLNTTDTVLCFNNCKTRKHSENANLWQSWNSECAAPDYLSELLVPASTRSSRHCLRSSDSNQLVVLSVKLSTYGRRAFSVSGPAVVWNSLPDYLRDRTLSHDSFKGSQNLYLFACY